MDIGNDVMRNVIWSATALGIAALGLVVTVQLGASASALKQSPILIRDKIYPGIHHLQGTINVPKTCDELVVHTEQVTKDGYRIVFETWEDPSLNCLKAESPREFEAVAFAPSVGTHFTATIDGAIIPIAVVQDTSAN